MRPLIALATLLALLVPAAGALASGQDVIRDCTDDEVLSKTYTQREYREALRDLPADADQYGNCRNVIARAQQAALAAGRRDGGNATGSSNSGAGGGGSTTGGGGGGTVGRPSVDDQLDTASTAEREALERMRSPASRPAATVDPAKVGIVPDVDQASGLPAPLLVLLAMLAAGGLAIAGFAVRRLVHARGA